MNDTLEIKTKPIKKELVSPNDYVKIPREDIEYSRVISPKLGSRSLGKIKVVYKHVKYRPIRVSLKEIKSNSRSLWM